MNAKLPKPHDPVASLSLLAIFFALLVTLFFVVMAVLIVNSPDAGTETVVPARLLPIPDPVASQPDPTKQEW